MQWALLSLPTLIGFFFEAIGLYPVAVFIYTLISKFNYPMAQYHLGILYADGEGVDIDIEHAKKLMRASSEGGYVRATEWLTNFENMTQESAESINALIYDRYSRFTKVLTFIRPTLWLFGLAYFIYFLVK